MKPLHNLILLFVLTLQTAQLCYSQATRETAQLLTTPGTFEVINNADEYWYKYIADSACTVTFSTDFPFDQNSPTFNIFIYKGNSENYLWYDNDVDLGTTNKSEASATFNKGDTVYFKVNKDFSYSLSKFKACFYVSKSIKGLSFNNPIPVSLDSIPMRISNTDKNHSYTYFELTATENMRPNFSLGNGISFPSFLKKQKNGTYIQVDFGETIIYSGDTYLFEFPHIYSFDYNWYFKAMQVTEIGTECQSPKKIDSLGIFELDNTNGSEWMVFLAEKTGYYTVSIGDTTNPNVKLIKWNYCIPEDFPLDNENGYYDTITSRKFETYQEKGSWVKLEFTGGATGEKYYAKLSYEAERLGDICNNPMPIVQDSNYVILNRSTYYKFTPAKSDYYLVTTNSNSFGLLRTVINGNECNFNLTDTVRFINPSDKISYSRLFLEKDTSYVLNFIIYEYNTKRTSFNLKNYIFQKGDVCTDAIEIKNTGKHLVDHQVSNRWLKFVAPSTGLLYASTLDSTQNETYIQIYKSNCDSLLAENRRYGNSAQSYVDFFVNKGDTILIKLNFIEFYSGAYPIFIDYKEIFKYGMNCERPLPIAEIPSSITTEKNSESEVIYYSFSTENETEVTISDLAKANIFQLFSACSKRVATSESGEVSVIIPAGNYQIQWQNMTGEPINWNISFNNNPDTDKDGKPNTEDDDDDNDGVLDSDDAFPYDKSETADNDKDGIGDNADTDDDNDGTLDIYDSTQFGSVSVVETSEQTDFKVIPNPAHDKIQLTGLAARSTVSLKIIDSKGAVVVSQESYLCGTDIDVRKLKKGRYYIVIQDKDLLVTSSFDKQ